MSQHHRAQRWTSFNAGRRRELEQQLPLPCMDGCGASITRDTPRADWQVGHRLDAARGGRPTRENTGAILTACNRRAGGKLGAAMTKRKRDTGNGIRPW